MSNLSFQATLEQGLIQESHLCHWLCDHSFLVIPAYQVIEPAGKGPRCFGPKGIELITPDMLCIHPSKPQRWIDSKAKTAATWHRKTQTWQTGFDVHSLNAYYEVQKISKIPVHIMFLHSVDGVAKDTPEGMTPPSGLFYQTLDWLLTNIDHSYGAMHYWQVDKLIKIANYYDVVPDTREF